MQNTQTFSTAAAKNKSAIPNRNAVSSMKKEDAAHEQEQAETKSIDPVVGESLAKDNQNRIDQTLSQASGAVDSIKTYVSENPKEALALGVSVAFAAWALLYTKPGRQLFDKAAPVVIPQASKWLSQTFVGGEQKA